MPTTLKHSHPAGESRPAINISKFTVGGGFAGLLVAGSILAIGLAGIPFTRGFLALSLLAGAVFALILRWTRR
jgi:hypothetical protein